MKYIGIVCFFCVSIVLSGCAKNTGNIENASKVYDAIQGTFFSSTILQSLEKNYFDSTGIVRESFGLYSKSDNSDLLSDIHVALTTDSFDSNTQSSLQISGIIVDQTNNDTLSINNSVYYIMSGDKQYINRSTGTVSLGEGNAEGVLINMILSNIAGQWMLLDDSGFINIEDISVSGRKHISDIIIKTRALIQSSGVIHTTYDPIKMHYPITINASHIEGYVSGIYSLLGLSQNQAPEILSAGYIDVDNRHLVIENITDMHADWSLTGWLGIREGSLFLTTPSGDWALQRKEKSQSISLEISQSLGGMDIFTLQIRLIPKQEDGMLLGIGYNGELSISTSILGNKKALSLPIAGLYTIHIVDSTQFAEPTRYLLMSQVFGDEYGIANLLEEK